MVMLGISSSPLLRAGAYTDIVTLFAEGRSLLLVIYLDDLTICHTGTHKITSRLFGLNWDENRKSLVLPKPTESRLAYTIIKQIEKSTIQNNLPWLTAAVLLYIHATVSAAQLVNLIRQKTPIWMQRAHSRAIDRGAPLF
jgi:hypothetical protein